MFEVYLTVIISVNTVRKLVLIIVIVLLASVMFIYFTKTGCAYSQGKWGHNDGPFRIGMCTTQLCYQFSNCGAWASPVTNCRNLKEGDSISKVFFEMGMPQRNEETIYYWEASKSESFLISAQIEDKKLVKLNCGVK